jgi:hypothetical protein
LVLLFLAGVVVVVVVEFTGRIDERGEPVVERYAPLERRVVGLTFDC